MVKVAIYTRLSQDRDGTKTSTARQEADCRALAKSRGWKVAEVFTDSGLSAFNGKDRPAFRRMLSVIDSDSVGGVLAWKVDRLGRRTADVVSLIERVNARGGFVATCDGLDSSSAVGQAVMSIAGIFAQLESANTSTRTIRAKLAAAQQGRVSGGGRRPYGYTADGMQIVPEEAARIREAVAAVLAGAGLRGIANGWSAAGVPAARGGTWSPTALGRLLASARIAGLRSYKGEVIGEASWPAIISREDHEQIVAILNDPARRTSRPGARKYLLTGLSFCGRCGEQLVASPRKGKRAYACRSQRRGRGCGGVRILAEPLDDFVAEELLYALDTPELTRMRRASSKDGRAKTLTAELRRDEAALERLTKDYYVERRIGRAEFMAAHDALMNRIDATRTQLAEAAGRRTVATLPSAGAELRAQWAIGDVTWRRSVVEAVIRRIDVGPSKSRGRTDLDRVSIAWRP